MSAKSEKLVASKALRRETYVNFDPVALKAPFLLRCGALMIDYIFVISVPVISLIVGRFLGNDGSKLLNSEISNAGWLIAVLLGITNFVIFPMFAGQSLGKMLTGLRIVNNDGSDPGIRTLILRNIFGYLMTAGSLFIGFLISVLSSKGRALHDYVAGTVVIYANKTEKLVE